MRPATIVFAQQPFERYLRAFGLRRRGNQFEHAHAPIYRYFGQHRDAVSHGGGRRSAGYQISRCRNGVLAWRAALPYAFISGFNDTSNMEATHHLISAVSTETLLAASLYQYMYEPESSRASPESISASCTERWLDAILMAQLCRRSTFTWAQYTPRWRSLPTMPGGAAFKGSH